MLLLLISFVSGVLTILAPCILPLLPVIVGHSITDTTPSRRRLFVVVFSLAVSVILFTLLLKASSLLIDIPQDFWKWISGSIIFFFGITMIFPSIWERFSFANTVSLKSNKVLGEGYKKNSIWGDVIIGASLGPIFSACSPTYFVILATILPVSPVLGMIYLIAYVLGLALALIIVVLLGERIMTKVGKVSDPRGWFKKIFGIIFILVALAIISGYDKKLQINLLDAGFFDVTKIEQKLLDNENKTKEKNMNKNSDESTEVNDSQTATEKMSFLNLKEKSKKFDLAPDLSSIDGYINTNNLPITISQYKGKKVILLDIWTYSCINCQRTIPYLNEWHKKYEDDGLVTIGLHTPEFAFEKIQKNVESAVRDFGIKYPVVLDNDFSTWNAYENRYWPRKYLIDIDGYIVYDHAGEGAYEETEREIQKALNELNYRLKKDVEVSTDISKPSGVTKVDSSKVNSPETYFGSSRNEYLVNGERSMGGEQTLILPSNFFSNKLYLGGTWNITSEYAENINPGSIIFNYEAKNVYITAGSSEGVEIEVYKDNLFIKKINIKDEQLYQLISDSGYGKHILHIKIPKAGLQAFTLTFG
jgi:cytochrome c biogenesis protein CcdA/thiol-disulfide isomerase/thioredoxin